MASCLGLACAIILSISDTQAQSADPSADWTVACSQGGRLIYVEHLATGTSNRHEAEIVRRFPDATCVFLRAEQFIESYAGEIGEVLGQPDSLDAALRAISGEPLGITDPNQTPIKPGVIIDRLPPVNSWRPNSPEWARINVYKDMDINDVVEHWNHIKTNQPKFHRFTADLIQKDEQHYMLSIGPVFYEERDYFCHLMFEQELDCIFGRGEPTKLENKYLNTSKILRTMFGSTIKSTNFKENHRQDYLTQNMQCTFKDELASKMREAKFIMGLLKNKEKQKDEDEEAFAKIND